MTRRLDPRFRSIVTYMEGAESYIERDAARENAEAVAKACGFTFEEALAAIREPSAPASCDLSYPSTTERDRTIAAALADDPSRSDRDIAREAGCSPTTVGKARVALGLARPVRAVHRGGQAYAMRLASAAPARGEMS